MFLYGGPAGYALWLSEGDENGVCIQSLIMYIDQNKEGVADYQGIGQTYPGIEIEERHLTSNIDIVIEAVRYFAQTGKWNQKIPYIVRRIDEDGIEREYT